MNVSAGLSVAELSLPICGLRLCGQVRGLAPGANVRLDLFGPYFSGSLGISIDCAGTWFTGGASAVWNGVSVRYSAVPVFPRHELSRLRGAGAPRRTRVDHARRARGRNDGEGVPRGRPARGSGLAGVTCRSSARARGARARVRRCGLGPAWRSLRERQRGLLRGPRAPRRRNPVCFPSIRLHPHG